MEAVIPMEIGLPSFHMEDYNLAENDDHLRANLDLLEATQEQAWVRMAAFKQRVARYYNSSVKERLFQVGNLVLQKAEASQPNEAGKLALNWEGLYQVIKEVRLGTYRLQHLDGTSIP